MDTNYPHKSAQTSAVSTLYALYGQEIKKVFTAHSQNAIELMSQAQLEPAWFETTRRQTWQDLAAILNADLGLATSNNPPAPAGAVVKPAHQASPVDLALAFQAQDFKELSQPHQIVPLMLFVRSRSRSRPSTSKNT